MSTQTSARLCGESPSTCKADGDTLHHYFVVSGEIESYYGYDEPTEYWRDVICVDARTKREALLFGVLKMESWPQEARSMGVNPLFGCKVDHIGCEHRKCWCDLPEGQGMCGQCLEKHIAEDCDPLDLFCWHYDVGKVDGFYGPS